MTAAGKPLLEVNGLSLEFATRDGVVRALDRVSYSLAPGRIMGVVGESGSGKSVMAFTLLGLLDSTAKITGGSAMLGSVDLLRADERTMRSLRGSAISMIFQSPRAALNPIRSVGDQLKDVLRAHGRGGNDASQAVELLRTVKIADPERRLHSYPYELSGGMCQRVMIALALACSPKLLVADEPTTGLDVTTQAAIMDLLVELARSRGMATLFITHDLALASRYCDEVAVMHAGQMVERAPAATLHRSALHPYTRALFRSTPGRDTAIDSLSTIAGTLPDLRSIDLAPCRFAGRCSLHVPQCDADAPVLELVGDKHEVACFRSGQ